MKHTGGTTSGKVLASAMIAISLTFTLLRHTRMHQVLNVSMVTRARSRADQVDRCARVPRFALVNSTQVKILCVADPRVAACKFVRPWRHVYDQHYSMRMNAKTLCKAARKAGAHALLSHLDFSVNSTQVPRCSLIYHELYP